MSAIAGNKKRKKIKKHFIIGTVALILKKLDLSTLGPEKIA